jgi:hypothetical protein
MSKILIVSHSPYSTTGYGRVVRGLAGSLLAAGHQIICLGAGTKPAGLSLPYPVMPWNKMSITVLAESLASHRPDVLLTIGDPWMFEGALAMPERQSAVWLAYYPVDGYPLPASWSRWAGETKGTGTISTLRFLSILFNIPRINHTNKRGRGRFSTAKSPRKSSPSPLFCEFLAVF